MNPTVSIIVPIYNGEVYIKRCVDSILKQEYTDFELILSDDGSTDGTAEILDEYAREDSRIIVVHKENSGVSDTRNRALRHARGIYLQFVDCDDWLTQDAVRLLVRAAKEHDSDMVISDFYRVSGKKVSRKGDIEEEGELTREEFAGHMMKKPADFYYGVLWNKLFRRELVEKYHLYMDPEISWCEDFMFNLEYIRRAERFYVLRSPIYYYVKTKGSLASQGMSISKTIKMKRMVFEYYNNFYKHVLDEEDYEKNRLQVYRFFVDGARDGMVPPFILPGAKKLGEERMSIFSRAAAGEGPLSEEYRERKLLEYYLGPVAAKNNLTMAEVRALLYLSQCGELVSWKELVDFSDKSRNVMSRMIQKLTAKDLIKVEENKGDFLLGQEAGAEKFLQEKKPFKDKVSKDKTSRDRGSKDKVSEKKVRITILPAADSVLQDISVALEDYNKVRFEGFTEEETAEFLALSEKMKKNIQKVLS